MSRTKPLGKCACRKRPRRKCAWHALLDGTLTVTFVDKKPKRSPPSRRTARAERKTR